MAVIKEEHLVQSVADALQYVSYYHPPDFIRAMVSAWEREEGPAAKDAIRQVLVNSRMCYLGKRPICQDTGIVIVFLEVGMHVQWDTDRSIDDMVNEGVRRAYLNSENPLRGSVLTDPDGARKNTKDNTPAVIHTKIVPGDKVVVEVSAKGGGSEHKARFTVLESSSSVVDWILKVVPEMGSGWCPPGMLGIGIGGSPEKAMLLAKESLREPIDIQDLIERGPSNRAEELRLELYARVNALGIGAQGLGGLTTVLDVKVRDYPTHAANKPVAVIPNCIATRHVQFELDGSGVAQFTPPDFSLWPDLDYEAEANARRVNLDTLTKESVGDWQVGEVVLISGKILTGRDAAHIRLCELLDRGQSLPVDLKGRFLYYVGPVDSVRDEVIGPAGPTTATRMDKFTDQILGTGLLGMIGKAERSTKTCQDIAKHGAVYLIAVGGAAYLISKSIIAARRIAFEELGMEAIHEFEVRDMPVMVAVDSLGNSVHELGPRSWQRESKSDIRITHL
ncbi:MAG: fumarate hydratase [Gammaproteobacteria bacterium]|nr:fumarate hydratase [Gammaproteobacteria bacterium]MYI77365.1 fumarate hydratase [Gammaproteobacteria bacterium]